jgi:hypothetical protein
MTSAGFWAFSRHHRRRRHQPEKTYRHIAALECVPDHMPRTRAISVTIQTDGQPAIGKKQLSAARRQTDCRLGTFLLGDNSTLRGRIDVLSPSEFLNDSPRPCAIFSVIARPLVHDGRPVLIPDCIFMVQPCDSLLNSRKCAESSSPRKIEGDCLLA